MDLRTVDHFLIMRLLCFDHVLTTYESTQSVCSICFNVFPLIVCCPCVDHVVNICWSRVDHVLTKHWSRVDHKLIMRWSCVWWCIDHAWSEVDHASTRRWSCIDQVLILSWSCVDQALVMSWSCVDRDVASLINSRCSYTHGFNWTPERLIAFICLSSCPSV